jgi:RHS repeat-associated protein
VRAFLLALVCLIATSLEASTVVWTGTHDPRCGYPQHNCVTSEGHVYINVFWAGVPRSDNYNIYNDRGDLMAQLPVSAGSGSAVVDRGVFYMCDCLPGTYEVLDLIATRAASYQYGDQLPAAGGDILTGVVSPGLNCTDGCPGGPPTNVITVNVYLGTAIPPTYLKCGDLKEGGDKCKSCGSRGMARYSVHSMLASLNIEDTPVGYAPPRGPAVNFTASYNQRDAQQPPSGATYSNMGPKWSFNWLSYVTDDPNTQLTATFLTVTGGGTERYLFDSGTQTFSRDPQTHAQLVRISASNYERQLPDGSKQVFSKTDNATSYPRKIFMTQWIDPANNGVEIRYLPGTTKIDKLVVTIDGVEQQTTFSYEDSNDPYKITKVTDPFNRSALLAYNNGQLISITDPIGIVSAFHYTPGTDFIDTLTSPYGPTTFTRGQEGTIRWLGITDPEGGKERVEYRDNAPSISATEATVPSGFASANAALNVANSFFWSKKAMQLYPPVNGVPDYTKAKITHWLYNSDGMVSGIPASEKAALENRVWHSYAGQPDSIHVGADANPIKTARVLDDGTTQLWQYEYNSFGKMTKSTDPVGRVMSYDYDPNNIDLVTVRQITGSNNEVLRTLTYNTLHEVRTDKDAAGQTTIYTYRPDGHGQLQSIQNAKGETTVYDYDPATDVPAGYLASITSPAFNGSSAVTSFTYDSANRVRATTNSPDNYTVTTDYDALDRKIKISYPDTTYKELKYTDNVTSAMTLDLTGSRDRRGRWTNRHYNGNRQMDSMKDPFNRETLYGWCTCGSLTSITDPRGKTTTFNHDLQSRVTSKGFVDNTSISYVYENTTSRLKSMTDAKNQRINYQYFADDNLQQVSYTNTSGQPLSPPTATVNFTYDLNYNRIATMVDGSGTTNYSYYQITSTPSLGAGQLQTVDGPLANDAINYGYDELGRATSRSINGVAASVSYDSLGRLDTSDNVLGHFSRIYDGTGNVTPRLKTLNFPNGQTTDLSYFDNSHDRRLQTLQDLTSGSASVTKFDYTYDPEGQIYPTWTKRLSTSPATTSNFTYDLADQLTGVTNTTSGNPPTSFSYGYDTAGNRTSDSATPSYAINDVNEITNTGYTYDLNGNLTSDGVRTFEWDAANRLTAIVHPGEDGRTEFTYDGLSRRVQLVEKDSNGTIQRTSNFVWEGMTIAEERNSSNTVIKRFLSEGVQLATGTSPNAKLFYSRDHLGSIRSLTNETGTLLATLDYDVYGNVSRAPVPDNDTSGAGPTLLGAVSRLTHGSAGTFDVNLPLTGAPGIEMRGGGNYTIVLTFDRPVVAATSTTIASGVGTVSGVPLFVGNTATVQVSGVADRQTITVELDNVVGVTGTTAKVFVAMSVLAGDVNQNGAVTVQDINLVKSHVAAPVDSTTFIYDTNHNGVITNTDVSQTKSFEGNGNSLFPDFAFTGHYYHSRSGLYLAPYRAYNPSLGRWLSRDPLNNAEMSLGPNLSEYVGNNPIRNIDPIGLAEITINGAAYDVTTRTEFIAALKASTVQGAKIHTFLFDGHAFPDSGELILTDQKNLDDINGVFSSNLLARYLEHYSDSFDPNVRVDLKACGTANGADSAADIFKRIFPNASVFGYTGYYLPWIGGVPNNWLFTHQWGGEPGVPYHSEYISK